MNLLFGWVCSVWEGNTEECLMFMYSCKVQWFIMKNNSLRNVFKSYILLTFDTAIFYKYFLFTVHILSKNYTSADVVSISPG